MTDQDKLELINRYLDAYNSFNVDGMMATVHPEVEFKNISGGEINAIALGANQLRQMAKQSIEIFTSRQQTIKAFDPSGEGASIDVAYEGVLASDFPNGMTTGETLKLDGRSEFEFKEGKIFRIVDYS